MALTEEQQTKMAEYSNEIDILTRKKYKLNKENEMVIKACKKADSHGCDELPGWAVFLLGASPLPRGAGRFYNFARNL